MRTQSTKAMFNEMFVYLVEIRKTFQTKTCKYSTVEKSCAMII